MIDLRTMGTVPAGCLILSVDDGRVIVDPGQRDPILGGVFAVGRTVVAVASWSAEDDECDVICVRSRHKSVIGRVELRDLIAGRIIGVMAEAAQ